MSSTEGSNGKGNGAPGLSTRWDKDLEKGDKKSDHPRSKSIASSGRRGSRRESVYPQDYDELDEYTALQKYIVSYRDPRAAVVDDAEGQIKDAEDAKKGKPWWAFWRKGGSKNAKATDEGVVPPDWLDTDMNRGITEHDVENRRKRFGFNELTTEKENMFLKFLSYFTGPILYGKLPIGPFLTPYVTCTNDSLQSWRLPLSSLSLCVIGSISVSLSVSCY
jgi:H+-transporting ATPase